MLDYNALKNEITDDPLNLGYSHLVTAGNDQAISDKLNHEDYTQLAPVPTTTVLKWSAANGVLAALTDASTTGPTQIRAICIASLKLLDNWTGSLDLRDPNIAAMLGALVAASIVTAQQRDDLIALATVPASRAEVLFGAGTTMTNTDISFALRGQR